MTIVSPTTNERVVRTLLLTGMFAIFGGYFLYDGYVGYPKKNLQKAVEALQPVPDQLPPIDPTMNKQRHAEIVAELKANPRTMRADLVRRLGEPPWRNPAGDELRYFGPAGVIIVKLVGDRVQDAVFQPGEKNEAELLVQKVFGFGLSPVALFMILHLFRVIRTKVVLDDRVLAVRGRPEVPVDAITGFNAEQFAKKGFLDVSYAADGHERTLRLDDYVIRDFRPLVDELCRRTGLPHPLPPPKD